MDWCNGRFRRRRRQRRSASWSGNRSPGRPRRRQRKGALRRVREFPLPQVTADGEASGVGQPIPEYDWVLTPSYAGPDRRGQATSFLNRFVLFGRRGRVPSRIARLTPAFVDRLGRLAVL